MTNILKGIAITSDFAKDLKIKEFTEPRDFTPILDDWVIDRMILKRKKVAIISNTYTFVSFAIPYNHIGGAINIPDSINVLLKEFLYEHELEDIIDGIDKVFGTPYQFCKYIKNLNFSHIARIKDFILNEYSKNIFEDIDWDKVNESLNYYPLHNNKYCNAIELAKNYWN